MSTKYLGRHKATKIFENGRPIPEIILEEEFIFANSPARHLLVEMKRTRFRDPSFVKDTFTNEKGAFLRLSLEEGTLDF